MCFKTPYIYIPTLNIITVLIKTIDFIINIMIDLLEMWKGKKLSVFALFSAVIQVYYLKHLQKCNK